jgi:hypothetical protein
VLEVITAEHITPQPMNAIRFKYGNQIPYPVVLIGVRHALDLGAVREDCESSCPEDVLHFSDLKVDKKGEK